MKHTRVAAVQMSSQDDVATNLDRVDAALAEARGKGASIVLLPENFAYMGDDDGRRGIAEDLDDDEPGPIRRRLSAAAKSHGVHLIAGGMPERSSDPQRPYNTCAVFGPGGGLMARYRKIHLFDVDVGEKRYRESGSTTAGDSIVVADLGGIRVGLSICYDLRFPELFRALSAASAEVLVVPAAFTVPTGRDHWHVLLRARAIEAQSYVVAAGQWGKHPRGRQTYGKSCIVDPWGDVIAQASEGPGIIVADYDRQYLEQVRTSLPALEHRRLH